MVFCFAHRLNNVLKLAFYQTPLKKEKLVSAGTTTPSKKQLKKYQAARISSSDESSSDDDTATPSPSKYIEANTLLSDLPIKVKEILNTITASKKLVKYVKLVSKTFDVMKRLISLSMSLSFF